MVDDVLCTYHIGGISYISYNLESRNLRPYLRPMSSMTEEEKVEWVGLKKEVKEHLWIDRLIDFYLSHHLDYRGLIHMGLAIEAPEGMYKSE